MFIRGNPKRRGPIHQIVQTELRPGSPDLQARDVSDPPHVIETLLSPHDLPMQPSRVQIRHRTEVVSVHPVGSQRVDDGDHIAQKRGSSYAAGIGSVPTGVIQRKYAIQEPASIEVSGSRW